MPVPHAGGTYKPKKLFEIIGGLLALESSWAPPLGDTFRKHLFALRANQKLQIGCALRHGAFDVVSFSTGKHDQSNSETALIFFFLRLFRRLQQLGTVPAIDLRQYGKNSGLEQESSGEGGNRGLGRTTMRTRNLC